MPIPVTCECGRFMQVKDELAGQQGKCPFCGRLLHVPAETPLDHFSVRAGQHPSPSQSVRNKGWEPAARPSAGAAPALAGTVLMMLAVAWWALGLLFAEQIFIYPAILFFLGLATLISWLTSRD